MNSSGSPDYKYQYDAGICIIIGGEQKSHNGTKFQLTVTLGS